MEETVYCHHCGLPIYIDCAIIINDVPYCCEQCERREEEEIEWYRAE